MSRVRKINSFNPVVQAIKSFYVLKKKECLEETGIDLATEASGPVSSREASSKTDSRNKHGQLLSNIQIPWVNSAGNEVENSTSQENDKRTEDKEIFIFQSQNKPSSTSKERLFKFSSGRGKEWGGIRKEEIKQNVGQKRKSVFQERKSNEKGRRKLMSDNKSKMMKIDIMFANLNKNFEEIGSHKPATSLQVMRENVLNDEKGNSSVCNVENDTKAVAVSFKNDYCTNETEKIDKICIIESDHGDIPHSTGCSSVKKFRKEPVNCKKVKILNNVNEVKDIQSKPVSNNCKTNDKDLKKKDFPHGRKKFALNLFSGKSSMEKVYSKEEHSLINTSLNRNSSPPEKSVRFLNLSQSQERAKVMNKDMRSLESSLKKAKVGCSGEANVNVSSNDFSAEWEFLSICRGIMKSHSEALTVSGSKTYSPEMDRSGKIVKNDEHSDKGKYDEMILARDLPVLSEESVIINKKKPNSGENQKLDSNQRSGEKDHRSSFSPKASKEFPEVPIYEVIREQLPFRADRPQENSRECKDPKGRHNRGIVRFKKECDTSGACVEFLKVGKLSNLSHTPKIKFWYLGTCMAECESQTKIMQWITKESRSIPVHQSCKVQFEGISKKQTLDSSIVELENVMPISQSEKNKDTMIKTSSGISCKTMIERKPDLSANNSIRDNMKIGNNEKEQTLQVSVNITSPIKGMINSEYLLPSEEYMFNPERRSNEPLKSKKEKIDRDFYYKHASSSSSSEKLCDSLPENKREILPDVVEPERNGPPSDDNVIFCLDNNKPLEKVIHPHGKTNVSQVSFNSLGEDSIKSNEIKEISPLESERYEGKTPEGIYKLLNYKLKNNPLPKNCEEVSNTDRNMVDLYRRPLLQDYKPRSSDSQNKVGEVNNKLNSGQVMQAMQEHILNKTPAIAVSNKKRVRPLPQFPFSSKEKDSTEKPCKKSCAVEAITTSKDNSPRNLNSSVIIISDEDEYDLLNSQELLQRIMDNINEDLGYNKPSAPKSKGARKKIGSNSEDKTEVLVLNNKMLCKPPECENQKLFLEDDEDDIFKDIDLDGDYGKDVIEDSPKKSVSDRCSKGKDISGSKYLSKEGPSVNISRATSSKFILPLSSSFKKLNMIPKSAVTFKSDNLKNNQNNNVKSLSLGTANNSQKKVGEISRRKINIFHKPGNDNGGLVSLTTKKTENVEKLLLVCSGLPPGIIAKVKRFAQVCGAGFSDKFCLEMTHLIVKVNENRSTPKTLKYLQAVATKKWIVSYGWILACTSAQKLLPENDYEAVDALGVDGPRKSRLCSDFLFKHVQVCLIEPFISITPEELQSLVLMCDAMLMDRPEDFWVSRHDVYRVIVTDMEDGNAEAACQKWLTKHRAVAVISDWILDSLGTYTLLPLSEYLVASFTDDQLQACGISEKVLYGEDLE